MEIDRYVTFSYFTYHGLGSTWEVSDTVLKGTTWAEWAAAYNATHPGPDGPDDPVYFNVNGIINHVCAW